jgi:hypothetical protein
MKRLMTCAVALAAMAAGAAPVLAQTGGDEPPIQVGRENTGVGTTSAEFLLMGAGARGMAIGNSFAALTRDVEALYYNPAALPLMEGMEARVTMMPYFADTNYLWAGFALPLRGGEYGFGLSIANFGFSDQPIYNETDQENASEQTYSVSETVVGLSFAHAFIDRFSGGFTFKLISDQLGQASAIGFAADIGTSYHAELAGRPIAMSFVIQNLGSGLKHSGSGLDFTAFPESEDPTFPVQGVDPSPARFEASDNPIPVVFRVGVAYDVLSAATNRLSLLGEFNETYNAGDPSFGLGGEFEWRPENVGLTAALRGSYNYQPDNSLSDAEEAEIGEGAGAIDVDGAGLDGMVLGAGLAYRFAGYEVRADYAFRHFGVLGARNVFTVGFAWR